MGASPFDLIGGAIGTATDLFKTIYGVGQMIGGNKDLNQLEGNMPQYMVDSGIQDNANMAAQTASQGFGDATKNYYGNMIERGLGSTIQAGLQTGQGLEFVNNAFGGANDAFMNFLSQDAQQKLKNQEISFNANKDLRDEKLRAWDYNENLPFQLKWNRATQQTNAGAQNMYGGAAGTASNLMGLGDILNG